MSKQFAFNSLPLVKKKRSAFDLSHSVKTTMNAGTLYPIYLQEVYPGDTFKDKTNIVARVSSAFLRPVVDNAFMDVYFFFVPNRLVYDKWSQVMGENVSGAWAQQTPVPAPFYTPDSVTAENNGIVYSGSVGDYLGLPLTAITDGQVTSLNYAQFEFNLMPFRAFALIWDEWFRDQNNIQPMNIIKGDYNVTYEKPNNSDWSPTNYMGKLPKVGKVHDYFTSCLPAPQKGDPVEFGGGSTPSRILPVSALPLTAGASSVSKSSRELFGDDWRTLATEAGYNLVSGGDRNFLGIPLVGGLTGVSTGYSNNYAALYTRGTNAGDSYKMTVTASQSDSTPSAGTWGNIQFSNFAAYDDGVAVNSISINELRYAIALQRMLEKDALGGNRYTEYLLSHFGVLSPDARLQRSELLGGHRFPLSVQQVAQTSEPTSGNPLGSLGAYSLSNGGARFTKGFVEHGFVIGVACIRQYHTYQQGLERFWSRKNRIDYYDPVFAHIGEQPVYKRELFTTGNDQSDVFGYNEAWADLRYRPNRLTGQMRSDISNSLDIWHFADDYANAPTLNQDFIQETPAYIDRTLAVPSASQDQFLVDIYHQVRAYRCLPVYSTPSTLGV